MRKNTIADDISKAIKQAGFKSKADFARVTGISHATVKAWGVSNPVPPYLFLMLEWAKKAKVYDELMKDKN